MNMMATTAFADGADEEARLAALQRLDILDTAPEPEFDILTSLARRLLGCDIAVISLVDRYRQWFKSIDGLDAVETAREHAFCAHAVTSGQMLVVPNATQDRRFADNPLVTGAPHIRFYAGVPIEVEADGRSLPMGTICAIDDEPRDFTPEEEAILRDLGKLAESLLNARMAAVRARELAEERRVMMDRLAVADRQFRQAERMANIGSWRLTLDDQRTHWSDQVYVIHGLSGVEDLSLIDALGFFPPRSRALVSNGVSRAIETGQSFDLEVDLTTANGEYRRIHTMGEIETRDGQARALIGVVQDVTARYTLEQALRRTANTDELTGLSNRAHFNFIFEERFEAARTAGKPLAVLLLDLDNFKMVNDSCGHAAGDDLLRFVARQLDQPFLAECNAARLGGDEFVLIVDSPALTSDLLGALQCILSDLACDVEGPDGPIHVSASIGCALLEDDIDDRSLLLKNADNALYRAKRIKRGTASIWGEDELILPRELPTPAQV